MTRGAHPARAANGGRAAPPAPPAFPSPFRPYTYLARSPVFEPALERPHGVALQRDCGVDRVDLRLEGRGGRGIGHDRMCGGRRGEGGRRRGGRRALWQQNRPRPPSQPCCRSPPTPARRAPPRPPPPSRSRKPHPPTDRRAEAARPSAAPASARARCWRARRPPSPAPRGSPPWPPRSCTTGTPRRAAGRRRRVRGGAHGVSWRGELAAVATAGWSTGSRRGRARAGAGVNRPLVHPQSPPRATTASAHPRPGATAATPSRPRREARA